MPATQDEIAALRTEVEELRAEVARLRSQQAAHVCAQPQVPDFYQTAVPGCAGAPTIFTIPANAGAQPFLYQQGFANTACAAPAPTSTFLVNLGG